MTLLKNSGFHPGIYGLVLNTLIATCGSWIMNARSQA